MRPTRKFEILPHTADLRMRVFGGSLEDLFQNALAALAHIMGDGVQRTREARPQRVQLEAETATNLLIDFLSEALYLANVEKAIYDQVEFTEFSERELVGTLRGYAVDGFAEDVKAVTYHGAEIKKRKDGKLEIEIVLDI